MTVDRRLELIRHAVAELAAFEGEMAAALIVRNTCPRDIPMPSLPFGTFSQ